MRIFFGNFLFCFYVDCYWNLMVGYLVYEILAHYEVLYSLIYKN